MVDGWINHDGKSHLENSKDFVDVKFRSGRVDKGFSVGWYESWAGTHDHWIHDGSDKDIMAYKFTGRDEDQT